MDDFSKRFRIRLEETLKSMHDLCIKRVPRQIFTFTGSQLRMIDRLYEMTRDSEEGVALKTLAQKMDITAAAASEMVDHLVRRGALVRRSNPHDRRAVSLQLAPEWEKRFRRYEKQLDVLLNEFFSSLSPEEKNVVDKVSMDLTAFMQNQKELPEVDE